ncbi:hypothetical protein B7463_g5028, partial [Scytalidium lignicola]
MYSSSIFVALSALAALASAIPTPVQPAARCGTTIQPTQLAKFDLTTSDLEGVDSYHLKQAIIDHVVQPDTIVTFALFQIPPNKYGCQLVAQFGNDISLTEDGTTPFNARVNVTNIDVKGITSNTDLTTIDLKTFDNGGSLFGNFNLIDDTTQVVNTAICPANGGYLLFELAFDTSLPASTAASFPQNDKSAAEQGQRTDIADGLSAAASSPKAFKEWAGGAAIAGAPNAPFFTPVQSPPAGTALIENPPTLFSPIKIRSQTFQNRIWVAPMCTYSADDGQLTDFHLVHLSAFAYRGASLTIIEATSVTFNGRISPEDSGLWKDSQIAGVKRVADFLHSQGQKLGIQLAHAGRKASMVAPWLVARTESRLATKEENGWSDDVVGASAIQWGEGYAMPKELTEQEIKDLVQAFGDAAKRAVAAGVDVIEIHGAHGYLISSFLSPISNRRTDKYGGSFENRIRFLVEVIQAIRAAIPSDMPLLVRVSATEWMDHLGGESWDVPSTIKLAKLLPDLGVDLLDVSSGGNNEEQRITPYNDFQIGIAEQIRNALFDAGIKNLLIGAVGMITEAEQAKSIVESGKSKQEQGQTIEIQDEQEKIAKADIVLVARQFLREPEWVLRVAHRLGVKVQWPIQYHRGQFLKDSKI